MCLGNPLETVVHYLLIGGIIGFDHWDGFPILVCMVRYRIRPKMSHDIGLSSSHDFTKLFHFVVFQL